MFFTSMIAFTRWSPFCYIKVFSSRQPVHSTLLWSGGYEFVYFAWAIFTSSVKFFTKLLFMISKIMSTKTFTSRTNSEAFRFFHIAWICYLYYELYYIYSSLYTFHSMLILLIYYFSWSNSWSEFLYTFSDLLLCHPLIIKHFFLL